MESSQRAYKNPHRSIIWANRHQFDPRKQINVVNGKLIPPCNTRTHGITPVDTLVPVYQPDTLMEVPDSFRIQGRLISEVKNQGLCANNWALVLSQTIQDVYAHTSGSLPSLSPTYLMACYSDEQAGCNGGSLSRTLKYIEQSGISERLPNEEWCRGRCLHLDQQITSLRELNSMIPACPAGNVNKLYIQNASYLAANDLVNTMYPKIGTVSIASEDDVNKIIFQIKQCIIKYGAVVGHMAVYDNFLTGDFKETDDVYLEKFIYQGRDAMKFIGTHALTILGWGQSPGGIPYWTCRNTWGKDWGVYEGFCKIAMYPFNQRVCFELFTMHEMITNDHPQEHFIAGGVYLFEPVLLTGNQVMKETSSSNIGLFVLLFVIFAAVIFGLTR